MKNKRMLPVATLSFLLLLPLASSAQPAASAAATDVYHVMFVKATPGQAAALAEQLKQVDPDDPMGSHFLLLRHVEGDDWDYCLVQHLGTEATVEAGPVPATPAGPPAQAWHDDTFVQGPTWAEFSREMGFADGPAGSVYLVGVHRAVPGHRTELLDALNQSDPESKIAGRVTLVHIDGAQWHMFSLDRYDSWTDFASDRTANAGASEGWLEIREHSAFHRDTLTERVR
jgi:hypothetical protein